MTQEELQNRYDLLVERVARMRWFQQQFIRYQASDDRIRARQLERQVDGIISEENKKSKSGQKEIF